MIPSERISQIYESDKSAKKSFDFGQEYDFDLIDKIEEFSQQAVNISCDAIRSVVEYLDEEAEKTKYACPNCHRIVDELLDYFDSTDTINNEVMVQHLQKKYKCKFCNK